MSGVWIGVGCLLFLGIIYVFAKGDEEIKAAGVGLREEIRDLAGEIRRPGARTMSVDRRSMATQVMNMERSGYRLESAIPKGKHHVTLFFRREDEDQ